jgi:two-component system chemotaxis response regulator CheB
MSDFSNEERELVFSLAENLIGSCQQGTTRKDILVTNVGRRMSATGYSELSEYLEFVEKDDAEFQQLLSALTIHTTSWFREKPHFDFLESLAVSFATQKQSPGIKAKNGGGGELFRVWCAACSSGEEVYSFAAVLERVRAAHPGFSYEILGSDVDPVSIEKAKRGIYFSTALDREVPAAYKQSFLRGSGPTQGLMTLTRAVRDRCRFEVRNLSRAQAFEHPSSFQFVVCRNVLIYFGVDDGARIVNGLCKTLEREMGHLCLGHSESVRAEAFGLELVRNCVYRHRGGPSLNLNHRRNEASSQNNTRKTVLVVDDSLTIRTLAARVLTNAGYEVLSAKDALEATAMLATRRVDAITLDVNMPGQDGLSWLAQKRKAGLKTPVIVLSDANADEAGDILGAMQGGAQEFIEKGQMSRDPQVLSALLDALVTLKPKNTATVRQGNQTRPQLQRPDVIVIGASTGGTEALTQLLRSLPQGTPPILAVQHISPAFASAFALRLAQIAGLTLGAFESGTVLQPGHLYMSLGDKHIEIVRRTSTLVLRVSEAPPQGRHRPSVDTLFLSTAAARVQSLGILLTGMGRDGARGLLELKNKGSFTCAQDEQSSVVFGMPREAIELGGATFVGNLNDIRRVIEDSLHAPHRLDLKRITA